METGAEIKNLLLSSTTSWWLRETLKTALIRNPIDVAKDAEILASILGKRAAEIAAQEIAWQIVQRLQEPPQPN
jgi:hypothetical protein